MRAIGGHVTTLISVPSVLSPRMMESHCIHILTYEIVVIYVTTHAFSSLTELIRRINDDYPLSTVFVN